MKKGSIQNSKGKNDFTPSKIYDVGNYNLSVEKPVIKKIVEIITSTISPELEYEMNFNSNSVIITFDKKEKSVNIKATENLLRKKFMKEEIALAVVISEHS